MNYRSKPDPEDFANYKAKKNELNSKIRRTKDD